MFSIADDRRIAKFDADIRALEVNIRDLRQREHHAHLNWYYNQWDGTRFAKYERAREDLSSTIDALVRLEAARDGYIHEMLNEKAA